MIYFRIRRADPDILQHHGVKGMHWGEWNAETAARYSGNGGKDVQKAQKKAFKDVKTQARSGNNTEILKKIHADPRVQKAYDEAHKAREGERQANEDYKKEVEKEAKTWFAYGNDNYNELLNDPKKLDKKWSELSKRDKQFYLDEAEYDVGDVGEYINDRIKKGKLPQNYYKNAKNKDIAYAEAVRTATKNLLGDYADVPVKDKYKQKTAVSEFINNAAIAKLYADNDAMDWELKSDYANQFYTRKYWNN